MIVDKMVAADMILFVSPVYWWGITAQLKLVIDKAYCKGTLFEKQESRRDHCRRISSRKPAIRSDPRAV